MRGKKGEVGRMSERGVSGEVEREGWHSRK